MKQLVAVLLAAAVFSTGATAQKTASKKQTDSKTTAESAKTALVSTERAFARTGAAKDIEAFMSFIADEAHMFSAGEMLAGKEAFREAWSKPFAAPNWSITWEPKLAQASAAGDLGYTTGPYEMKMQTPDGKTGVRRGSFVTIWRRQADGRWKVVLDIGNPAPPQTLQGSAP